VAHLMACKVLLPLVFAVSSVVPVVGCGSSQTADAEKMEASRLKPLSILYMKFTAKHRGQPPTSVDEFKQFIRADGGTLLSGVQGNVDDLLISERDGLPFVIEYKGPQGPQRIIAYEQHGVNGQRMVAGSLGNVMLVDEQEFDDLVPRQ